MRWSKHSRLKTLSSIAVRYKRFRHDAHDSDGRSRDASPGQRSDRQYCSVLGHVAPPFVGVYAASKFAVEGITEALRAELRPFSIHVSLIEPGFVRSNFVMRGPTDPLPEYGTASSVAAASARKGFEAGLRPEAVASAILRVVTLPSPRLRDQLDGQTPDCSR
jgi:NAD(P)-dependent dehydrogenase (short-subunit alcohol dehydrogenase family)